ncbi:MAG: hypothetical protein KQH79_04095 [Bacteroidetes bacterium]|nr:hypothetical protein [Bacteroidota bacterium]
MNTFKKSGYLRALFIGLPFGIYALYVGLSDFKDIPQKTDNLVKVSGIIVSHGTKEYYDSAVDVHREVYYFELDNGLEYYSELEKHKEFLNNINKDWINSGIEVWIKNQSLYIKQLKIDNKLIIKYEPPYWVAWFFTILGVVFTGLSVIYLIKYSSDFFS